MYTSVSAEGVFEVMMGFIYVVLLFVFFVLGCVCTHRYCNMFHVSNSIKGYKKRLFDNAQKDNKENNITLDGYFLRNNYKRIVIYGLGIYYKEFLANISAERYETILLSDKGAKAMSDPQYSITVPTELLNEQVYDIIVVTSYNSGEEIVQELRSMGIHKPIITYYDLVLNAFKERIV